MKMHFICALLYDSQSTFYALLYFIATTKKPTGPLDKHYHLPFTKEEMKLRKWQMAHLCPESRGGKGEKEADREGEDRRGKKETHTGGKGPGGANK